MRVLLLNQCFYPDVVSTAQHLTDLAKGLSERGHDLTVIASNRGYDDPTTRFATRESWNNIQIIRIPSLALGKETRFKRALNFASFLTICSLRLLSLKRFDVVVALTSPPLISFLASLFVRLKGGRLCCWIMDLNPDEAIAAGWVREDSLVARVLQRLVKFSLKGADRIIVLDRFMKARVLTKGIDPLRVTILPPWSHDDAVSYSSVGRARFRSEHQLTEKFVVMYSGNHSPCHPLDTLLDSALALSADERIAFCFVGGGSEKAKVREFSEHHQLKNVICLPYQPLEILSDSLSAADLHVVVLGDKFTGIVHPCKIYNILKVGVPILYIGPRESHVADIAAQFKALPIVFAQQGDTTSVVNQIIVLAREKRTESALPHEAHFSKPVLLPRMINLIELTVSGLCVNTYSPDPDSNAQEVVSL